MKSERLVELHRMLAEDSEDIFVLYAIALEEYKNGHADKAISQMMELIRLAPNYVPAYFRMGQWLIEKDHTLEAYDMLSLGFELAMSQNDKKAAQEIKELMLFIDDYEN